MSLNVPVRRKYALSDTSNAADYTVQVNGAILSVKETVAEALNILNHWNRKAAASVPWWRR